MRGWECGNFWHLKFRFSVQILERDFYSVAKRLSRPNSNHWNISLCGWVASCTFNQMRGLCDSPKSLQSPAKGTQFLWWPHLGYFSEKQRPFLAHCVFERNSMKLKRCHMASQVLWYAWTILLALLMWSSQRSGGALHAVLPLWIVPRWPVPSDHPDRWMNSSRSLMQNGDLVLPIRSKSPKARCSSLVLPSQSCSLLNYGIDPHWHTNAFRYGLHTVLCEAAVKKQTNKTCLWQFTA